MVFNVREVPRVPLDMVHLADHLWVHGPLNEAKCDQEGDPIDHLKQAAQVTHVLDQLDYISLVDSEFVVGADVPADVDTVADWCVLGDGAHYWVLLPLLCKLEVLITV